MDCFDVHEAKELSNAIERTRVGLYPNNELGWHVDFDEATLECMEWVNTETPAFSNTLSFTTGELVGRKTTWFDQIMASFGKPPGWVTEQAETVLFKRVLDTLQEALPNKYIECPDPSEERLHTALLNRSDIEIARAPDGTYHFGCDNCDFTLETDHTTETGGLSCGLPIGDCSYSSLPENFGQFVVDHIQQFCTECLYVSRWMMYAQAVEETECDEEQQAPHIDQLIESMLDEIIVVESKGSGEDHGKVWVFNGQRVFLPDTGFTPGWHTLLEEYQEELDHTVAPPTLPNHSETRWSAFLQDIVPDTSISFEQGPRSQLWRDYDSLVEYIREAKYASSLETVFKTNSQSQVVCKVDRDGRVFHLQINAQAVWKNICGADKRRKQRLGEYLEEKNLLNTDGKYRHSKVTNIHGRERAYWDIEMPLVKTDESDFEKLIQ